MAESPEIPPHIIKSLKLLGLTKYEALVYTALLQVEGASATEIHEISGVPRASVYPVLDKLTHRNLVSVSHATPRRYNAVPPDEGIDILLRHIDKGAKDARILLNKLYRRRVQTEHGSQELIWSIYGEDNIKHRIMDLVTNAQEKVNILTTWHLIKGELEKIILSLDGTIEVEIICDRWDGKTSGFKTIHINTPLYEHVKFSKNEMAGVFIIDDTNSIVLMGSEDATPTALYSESPGFIQFFKRYLSFVSTDRK